MHIELTIEELQRMFKFFNKKLFSNQLENVVIAIQTNGKHKNTLGWCTSKKVWNDKSGVNSYYEITICAEYLDIDSEFLVDTLIHEMVHLYNLQLGVKDTSRAGTYHNKKFKVAAEEHGLNVEKTKRYGFAKTSIKPFIRKLIEEVQPDRELFELARRLPGTITVEDDQIVTEEEEEKKSSSRKYICPQCETIIRATKEVFVICGHCRIEFEEEEKKDKD